MDLRALVVCPDQNSSDLLTGILLELGLEVEHAPTMTRGKELVESEHFDAVVLDYHGEPGSDTFLTALRQSRKNRTSMLVAIVDSEFNARPVFGLGANFVLYRPLSSERTRISLRAARGLMRRERRRTPRTRLQSTANVASPGRPEVSAPISDLSDGGTLIHTRQSLPASTKVYFEFALPGQKQPVRLSGEVAWQDSSGRTGIRFLDVPQSSRRLMKTWLQESQAKQDTASESASSGQQEPNQPAPGQSGPQADRRSGPLVSNAGNRRGERRVACKLGAEVYRLGSSIPNRCTLSDISEGGCYVEMPTPLGGQSGVEILVRTHDVKVRIRGQVLATHPGFGMGVRFMFQDSVEREEVLRLLAVLANRVSLNEPVS